MEELNTILYTPKLTAICTSEQVYVGVTGRQDVRRCGSMCYLLLIDMVKNTGRVDQNGKADEYSSKRVWSTISEQYPECLTKRGNPGTQAMV